MPTGPMVLLTVVSDPIEARIIAARLGAEGVLCRIRGGGGPYPLGPVRIEVPEEELVEALAVLSLADSDDPDAPPSLTTAGRAPAALWLVLLVIVGVALFGIARIAFAL